MRNAGREDDALQALLARQQAMLAAIPDIIMEVDADKVYTWANQAGLEFFGPDVIGREASHYFLGEQDTYDLVQPLFDGDESVLEQVIKQLRKLINTIKVVDLSEMDHVEREMVLVRVKAEDKSRAEVLRIADIFRCRVVDVSPITYTLEITGTREKTSAVLGLLKTHGILEVVRSGALAIQRAKKE